MKRVTEIQSPESTCQNTVFRENTKCSLPWKYSLTMKQITVAKIEYSMETHQETVFRAKLHQKYSFPVEIRQKTVFRGNTAAKIRPPKYGLPWKYKIKSSHGITV